MQPWFLWKGIDSRTMGVWVSELPPPTRATERTEEVEVPGRPGKLTIKEGDNVHDGYVRECRITVPANADFASLLTWLTGDGDAVFSNEADRAYKAHLAAEVKFTKISNSLKTATLAFYVHPHKAQYPPEPAISVSTSASIYNPGTVEAKPLIKLTGSGADITLTVNSTAYTYDDVTGPIYIDCDAQIITESGAIWDGAYDAEFPTLQTGANTVAISGGTCEITPRWRWI